jgi:hypothetical protein
MDGAADVLQARVEAAIRQEVAKLEGPDAAQALAALVILLSQLQEPSVPDELLAALPKLKVILADRRDASQQVGDSPAPAALARLLLQETRSPCCCLRRLTCDRSSMLCRRTPAQCCRGSCPAVTS